MIEEFAKHLTQNYKLHKDQLFLLACSGGVDSVVLAHMMHQLGYTFALAYCNFKLRIPDCDAEAVFVKNLGNRLDKTVFIKEFDTLACAEENKTSIQMAARQLRYTWFDQLLQEKEYTTLLTAHHADDQLETLLLNIGRGNGPSGLTGIAADTHNRLRPLLPFSKSDIITYAKAQHLDWCEDSSNAKNDYLRNAIRNEVLPLWEKHQPQLRKNLTQTLHYLQQAQKVLHKEIAHFKERHFKHDKGVFSVDIAAFKKASDPAFFLHHVFYPFGFEHTADLVQLLSAETGKQLFSKSHRLLKNRNELLLSPMSSAEVKTYPWDGVQALETPIRLISTSQETAQSELILDKEKLIFPLLLRKMKEGDYFYPSGMQGKKKLSKFFKDEKYSLLEKENQWLLCSGEDIVWIVGKRPDRRFLKSADTKQLFCIQTQ